MKAGGEPGAVYRFTPADLGPLKDSIFSFHEWGIMDSLQMMRLGGNEPAETIIIDIEPQEVELGMELTPVLQQNVPVITQVVPKETDLDK